MQDAASRSRFWRGVLALAVGAALLVIPALPARAATGTFTFLAGPTSASESAGALATTIDLTRDDVTDEVNVDYRITATTGTYDADFAIDGSTATTGTVNFPAGVALVSLTVTVNDDLAGEGPAGTESFLISLENFQNVTSPGDAYDVADTHALDIVDDGDVGTIGFALSSSSVNETDANQVHQVSLTRTGGTEGAATATVTSSDLTATSPQDYAAVNQAVNFAHGDAATKTVGVTIVGDNVPNENGHDFRLSLSGPNAGGGTHTVTINDDDQPGSIRFADTTPTVAESGGSVEVVFERIGGSDGTIAVDYTMGNITATAGADYTAGAGTLTFTQGVTSQSIFIPVTDDLEDENNETFQVNMTGDTTGQTFAVVTITDNDDPLAAIFDSYTSPEDTVFVATVGVLANDTGPGGVDLDVATFGTPTVGVLSALDFENGLFTYTPPENFEGQAFFSYSVTDGVSDPVFGTVRITITDSNAAPVANDDLFASVTRLEPTVLDVLANDTDQDGNGLMVLTGQLVTAAGNAVDCSAGTSCTFTPQAGFVGSDSFTYTMEDPFGASDTADVRVLVGMPRDCDVIVMPGVPYVGTDADEVICGTAAADVIDGRGGDDVILGMGGDDVLTGGDGKDRLVGGEGNDTLIPGPGDNDDTLGGPGENDVVRYTGSAANDTAVVSATSFSIDSSLLSDGDLHETVELIEVDLGNGNDSITVQAADAVAMDLDGGNGTDRLQYDTAGLTGVADSGAVIIADGKQPVSYARFEIRIAETFVITYTNGPDRRILVSSEPEGLILDPLDSGDDITILLGNLLGPVTLTDSGFTGTDVLTVLGSAADEDITIRPVSVRSGTEIINFSGIERLVARGGGGDDTFRMRVDAGFAPAAFTLTVGVDGGRGTDTLLVTSDNACALIGDRVIVDGIAAFDVSGLEVLRTECAGIIKVQSFASGYWLVDRTGVVNAFGLTHLGDHTTTGGVGAPVSGLATRPDKLGYWTVQQNGDVTPFGGADDLGDLPAIGIAPAFPIVGITSTATGDGYYLLGADGGVFSFGDAVFHGSTGDIALDLPVTAMAANPAGAGYWFVARDGGVFTYGPGTAFLGSVPQVVPYHLLQADIVGMAATASGNGYWLVAEDGGIFAFGDARFFGSIPGVLAPGVELAAPVVGMVATPSGNGYWVVAADGGVFTFGDAQFLGSLGDVAGSRSVVALAG